MMMTASMDNSSAPSGQELVQRLYNKNIELENQLRKAIQLKIPSDPNAWFQIRENYEAIILEDHKFSELHRIEYALWQLHYRKIEEFRSRLSSVSTGSIPCSGGIAKGLAQPDRIKKIRSIFKSFLSEATGFYHDLILKIRAKYGLPLSRFSEGAESQIILANGGKKSAEMKKGLISCHNCLIYLGDLARYKGLYSEVDSIFRDYAAASSYYIQAASFCPSSGNPHHQLAILASYSADDLMVVYHYFRSLAVESPFSTARDNLIMAFEKNHHRYSQLSGETKFSSYKTEPMQMTMRGTGETRFLSKDVKTETASANEKERNVLDTYKVFCIRFVRLNGILFTCTSLDKFGEVLSLVIGELGELLSSGPKEELNFNSDGAENRLILLRIITVLIFTVHNVNTMTDGHSYAEILQHSALLRNGYTAAFEFVGHILKRCIELDDVYSSSFLPAILIFIEWLACRPDIAASSEVEEKQTTARSFFWNQYVSFMNKLMPSGSVSVNGDEDEETFSMSSYDDGETGSQFALWEDFELRGFLPLLTAQQFLDFSRNHSFGSNGIVREKRARVQRLLAAGRALMDVVQVDQLRIYFNQKLKKFTVGLGHKKPEDDVLVASFDSPKSIHMLEGMPAERKISLEVMQPKTEACVEGEEEDEVIVFRPTVAERNADTSAVKSTASEVPTTVENFSSMEWSSYVGALSSPFKIRELQSSVNSHSRSAMDFYNISTQPGISRNTTKRLMEKQAQLTDELQNLNIDENGLVVKSKFQEGSGVSKSPAFLLPSSPSANLNSGSILSTETRVSESLVPSRPDFLLPYGLTSGDPTPKPLSLSTGPRKSPVSRPVRHYGPPPGFSSVLPKQPDDSMSSSALNSEHPSYGRLDGCNLSLNSGLELNNSLDRVVHILSYANGNHNSLAGSMGFPFPGKQLPSVQVQMDSQNSLMDHQLLEHLKHYQEQQQPLLQQGTQQQPSVLSDQYQGQNLWSGHFFD